MDATARLIKRSDMVACKLAFIDCKMPGSTAKENYSLIGAGVTQSADQVVNITEPHGFSLGVAAMPPGTTNNLHVHYTAEVFMIYSGTWVFRWGADGKDGEIIGTVGDVVSIPTWDLPRVQQHRRGRRVDLHGARRGRHGRDHLAPVHPEHGGGAWAVSDQGQQEWSIPRRVRPSRPRTNYWRRSTAPRSIACAGSIWTRCGAGW